MLTLFVAAIIAVGASAGDARAQTNVGTVERLKQTATASTGAQKRALATAAPLFMKETVETGSGARAEIRLTDQTTITMGERATLELDDFVIAQNGGTVFKLARGAMRYTSAATKDLTREVRLVTPVATIGIRGTDFWVGPIEGAIGVVLIDGMVEVTNAGGTVVLDEPREGTLVFGAAVAPAAPNLWPDDRVARALAATRF